MCGQVYVLLRICVDRPTYRQSKISKDEIQGPLNLADIFCFQLYVKFLCLSHFDIFLTDRQTDRPTKRGDHRSSSPELKKWQNFSLQRGQKKLKIHFCTCLIVKQWMPWKTQKLTSINLQTQDELFTKHRFTLQNLFALQNMGKQR